MNSIAFRLRTEARTQWAAWLGVAVVLALIGGLTMALVAGARRTQSVYDRFLERSDPADVLIAESTDFGSTKIQLDAAAELPSVRASAISTVYFSVLDRADGQLLFPGNDALTLVDPAAVGDGLNLPLAIEGRLADPTDPTEIVVGFHLAQRYDIRIGEVMGITLLPVESLPRAQADFLDTLKDRVRSPGPDFFDWKEVIDGPRIELEVVGITAAPLEFPPFSSRIPVIRLSPAFERLVGPGMWTTRYLHAQLQSGVSVEEYQLQVEREASNGNPVVVYAVADLHADSVKQGFAVQALGLVVLAGLFGLAGAVVAAQAASRLVAANSADARTLRAIGWASTDLARLAAARMLIVSVAAAAMALAMAVGLSPLWPDGSASYAEIDSGIHADLPTVLIAALLMIGLNPVLAAAASRSTTTRRLRTRATRPGLPAAGPPTMRLGIDFALDSRAAGGAVPVRGAIAATSAALSLLAFVLVVQAQSDRLARDPALYGWTWEVSIGSPGLANYATFVTEALAVSEIVDDVAAGTITNVDVNGRRVDVLAVDNVRGAVDPTLRAGVVPTRDGEMALGSLILDDLGVSVGDEVDVAVGARHESFEVVGEVITPTLGDQGRLGSGGFTTAAALRRLIPGLASNVVLVDFTAGTGAADRENIRTAFAPIPTRQATDGDELGFTEAAPTDTLVLIAVVISLAIIANVVTVSIRRRRGELAIVRALGLTRAQARRVIHVEAIIIAMAALLIGVPLGAIAGRAAWRAFLGTLGIDGPEGLDWQRLWWMAIVVVVLTFIIAVVPAWIATRDSPAERLRNQ